jgi:hypothetical protein
LSGQKAGDDFGQNSRALSDFLVRKDDLDGCSRQGSEFFYGLKIGSTLQAN